MMKSVVASVYSLWLLYLFSLFLMLGIDDAQHTVPRMVVFPIFIVLFPLFSQSPAVKKFWKSPSLFAWGFFLLYEIGRAIFLGFHSQFDPVTLRDYGQAPLLWGYYLGAFLLGASFMQDKSTAIRFLQMLAVVSVFLALNGIPPALEKGHIGWVLDPKAVGEGSLVHPVFLFNNWVKNYLISPKHLSNWSGDFMALGFFPALGLAVYSFYLFQEKVKAKAKSRIPAPIPFPLSSLVYFVIALVIGTGILAMLSRGTLMAFVLVLPIYFGMLFIKYRSKGQMILTAIFLAGCLGFFAWGGTFSRAWKELRTLEVETDGQAGRSYNVNKEGAERALRMWKAHRDLGVGTGAYSKYSKKYKGPKSVDSYANFEPMCHYIKLLAEEGRGALLYYLILIAYAMEIFWGLRQAGSRFKFIAVLSLVAPVLLVFIHASINDILQRHSMAMLIYTLMGASLGILNQNSQKKSASVLKVPAVKEGIQ